MFFIIIGIIQGIVEWLPVSSQGVITLITQAYQANISLNELNRLILLLHLGTFFAALVYFRKDVTQLTRFLFQYKKSQAPTQKLLIFLLISTIITILMGGVLHLLLNHYLVLAHQSKIAGPTLTIIVGILLIITGLLQLKAKNTGKRTLKDLHWRDGVILGLTQAMATLPGISRSGSTVSLLLLIGFNKKDALKMSFLMSLPVVLLVNIILNFNAFTLMSEAWPGLIAAFIFGLITIHWLLVLAERVNFSLFVLGFGALTIASVFL